MKKPYLSFVVTGRNDNYGHNFLGRFQFFLDNLSYLCESEKFYSELIIVDWNPPLNEKKMKDVLVLPENGKFLKIIFIEVPKKIHERFENSSKIPLLEFIAKNVGVRRASGEYILSTNPDIIFNRSLIRFFSRRQLLPDMAYRIPRSDVFVDIPKNTSAGEIEEFCRKKEYRIIGNFIKMHYPVKGSKFVRGFLRSFGTMGKRILLYLKNPSKDNPLFYLDGAPGDFMLMSRKLWFKVGGYEEKAVHGGLDALLMIKLFRMRIKLKRLGFPCKIYHQYHDFGGAGRSLLKDVDYKKKVFRHKEDWGLSDYKLKKINI